MSRDFRPLVFFIKQSHLGPLFTGLRIFEYGFEFFVIRQIRWHSDVYDTDVPGDLEFEWLCLPLKGISIKKNYIGKFYYPKQ
jgi:hypothetical protein